MTSEVIRLPNTRAEFSEALIADWESKAPVITWEEFLTWFVWNPGQHVAFIGPTDCGKTTFALEVLKQRRYVTACATKPYDETLERFAAEQHYIRLERWDNLDPKLHNHRMLWPDAKSLYAAKFQQREFRHAFASIYTEGGWTLYIDELWFICKHLKLEFEMRTFLLQSRSNNISLVISTQRPAWIPLEVYDMSRWLFFWRDNDEVNLSRISGISWLSKNLIRSIVARLDAHQVLGINTRTGDMIRVTCPLREGK